MNSICKEIFRHSYESTMIKLGFPTLGRIDGTPYDLYLLGGEKGESPHYHIGKGKNKHDTQFYPLSGEFNEDGIPKKLRIPEHQKNIIKAFVSGYENLLAEEYKKLNYKKQGETNDYYINILKDRRKEWQKRLAKGEKPWED